MTKDTSEYSWSDVSIVALGKKIAGARGVKYTEEQEKEPIYAAGNKPVAMGRGNKKYSAEIKILQSELEAIVKSAGGSPTDIPPFDVIVAYTPKGSIGIVTDKLVSCEFINIEKGLNQGDKFMEVTMPLVLLDIKYNQ